ncbi:hypothetical protein C1Y40_05775 [Mycobacterium talmoniae]|uniref:Uncharacterized protein n=1 Tax=Mycobacterium talmoniae TaxID=1858794 RepID=A0A2S8BBN7_9MYCO|nr:hypothetical protein C1Y40_05775 [Mycobacterium talmoniae]
MQVGLHHRGLPAGIAERRLAGQHPKQRAAQRVLVGAAVHGGAAQRLRWRVGDGGHHLAGAGQAGVVKRPGDAEVSQQHPLLGADLARQQEVRGFDVAVQHVVPVGVVERFGDLAGDVDRPLRGHLPGAQRGVGVGAVDELHGDPQLTVFGLAAPVNRHDVGMVQLGGHVGFTDEPGPKPLIPRQLGRQQFHCLTAGEFGVGHQIDRTHAALAEDSLDAVSGDQ